MLTDHESSLEIPGSLGEDNKKGAETRPRHSNLLKRRIEAYAHTSAWNLLGLGCLGIFVYAACYFAIGNTFLPGGSMWSLVVLWVFAHIGGLLITFVGLHSLLGMLIAGIVLRNIPVRWLIGGLPPSWISQIRQGALALIFLRSGMELDIKAFKLIGPLFVRLLIIPTIWEAIVSGTVAHPVFGMPWLLGYALGFILTAVGPAIVIQLMFDLQKEGWGVHQGIPATVVAAASFDDVLAITFYTIFINLALPEQGSMAFHIAQGPLNIVLGAAMGPVCALICCPTKLWDTNFKRTAILTVTALLFKWLLNKYGYNDGGTIGALFMGVLTNLAWKKGWPSYFSKGPAEHFAADAERFLGLFWKWIAQPLLFGAIGSGLNFLNGSVQAATIPKSLLVIASGWVTRFPITTLLSFGGGRNWKEKTFLGIAWLPKATVQAALAGAPLDAIRHRGLGPEWVEWGQQVQTTAIISILVCATISIILIHGLAPHLLQNSQVLTIRPVSSRVEEICAETGQTFNTEHASKGRIVLGTTLDLRQSMELSHGFGSNASLSQTPRNLSNTPTSQSGGGGKAVRSPFEQDLSRISSERHEIVPEGQNGIRAVLAAGGREDDKPDSR